MLCLCHCTRDEEEDADRIPIVIGKNPEENGIKLFLMIECFFGKIYPIFIIYFVLEENSYEKSNSVYEV